MSAHQETPKWTFRTHLLPHNYDIFGTEPGEESRTGSSKDRSVSRSGSRSELEKTKHL